MIQEIINFVDTLPNEVFTNNLQPKEGLYILLDIDEHGDLVNVDEEGKIKEEDIEKYLQKEEVQNGLSEHLKLCKSFYLNSQVMGKGTNKSFNSSLGIFAAVATPFGIGFRKGIFNDKKQTSDRKEKALEDYFNAASPYVGEEENYQEWFRRFKLFCQKNLLKFVSNHELLKEGSKENPSQYKLKDTEYVCFLMKQPDLDDYKRVSGRYFSEKIFNKAKETSKGKFGVYANTHNLNESKTFLRHVTGLTPSIKWLNGEEAAKVEQFYSIQKYLPKPFPLFIYKDEIEDAVKILKQDSKIRYAEMIKKMLGDAKDELHNYYLIFFAGADYSKVVDIDFVSTFNYSLDIQIKKAFPLSKDDFNALKINDVFEFEQQIFKTILNIHPNIRITYFDDVKFDTKYQTHNSFNQFLKYRKAFYDFIYKSKIEAVSQLMFDDILLKGILDDIKTDEYDTQKDQHSKRFQILTKLNIWFSLYNYFHSSNYKKSIDMISKIEKHRNKVDEIITQNALINSVDEFAYLAGQCIRYLFSKSETSDKSYNRLETFLQKTDCRLLQKAMANFFAMYKHKEVTNKFGKVFAQVMDYETTENVKDYLPEFLAGFFDNNQLFSEQKTNN
jgi:CRISPR-associated protein Csh1